MKNTSYKLFFKAVSNDTRTELIKTLRDGNRSVSQLCKATGFEQSRVSHNLRCLTECGFVEVKQNGKERVYSLNKKTVLPMLKIIDNHIKKYSQHLKKCGAVGK
jgi:DNA-binding transcriptional ArsR family regulator